MKLNREKLLEQLELIYPAIALNPIVPHYGYFKIVSHSGADVKDLVHAYNGLVVARTQLVEDIGHTFAIPAEPFLKLLRSLEDEEIELVFKDDEVKVRTNTTKGIFTILDETPNQTISISGELISDKAVIQDLVEGFNLCRMYASKDQTSGPMRGVKISGDKMIATDRYRVVVWRFDNSSPIDCVVPLKFIDMVLKNKDKIREFLFVKDDNFSVILNDHAIVSTKLLSGDYPDVIQYFPASMSANEIKFTNEMSTAIERHISFLSRVDLIDKEISVQILNDKCITRSEDKQSGGEVTRTLVDEVEVVSDGEINIEFLVNPVFLKDIIGICSCFKYYDESGLMVLEADKLSRPDKIQYLTQVRENE